MDVPTILKRIELRIIELGMTKTEFYEKSGISSATYSQWNTNTFQPSKRKLMAAASALKMTYEELVGEETTSVDVKMENRGTEKNKWVAFVLCLFLGLVGAHKFYEGKILVGVVYIFTAGLFFVGWIIDLIAILMKPNPYYV